MAHPPDSESILVLLRKLKWQLCLRPLRLKSKSIHPQYDLPIQHPTFLPGQIADFFDTKSPSETDPNIIQKIPTPLKEVILSLRKRLMTAKSSEMSIKCIYSVAAAGTTYPLWIIAYWEKVASVREIWDSWRKGEVYLKDCFQRWCHVEFL